MSDCGILRHIPSFIRPFQGRHAFVWPAVSRGLTIEPPFCLGLQNAAVTTLTPKNPLEET
jgi:hypothetical protein